MRWILGCVLAISALVLWQVTCLREEVDVDRVVIQEFQAEVLVDGQHETVTVYRFEGQSLAEAMADFESAIAAIKARR